MGYQYYIDRDLPYSSFSLDTLAGARSVAPLVSGNGSAQVVGGANTATFTFPGFQNSRRQRPFVLEGWFKPEGIINEQVIVLGHANYDGIIWDGTSILFIVQLANSTITLSYIPPVLKSYHVVVMFDGSTMALWVDGNKVDGAILTSSQVTDLYIAASDSATLVSGVSASGNARIIIDAFATYTNVVTDSMPIRHYNLGQANIAIMQMITAYGANIFELNDSRLGSAMKMLWNNTNWFDGTNTNNCTTPGTGTYAGSLMATAGNTAVWMDSLIVDGLTSVTGSVIEWDGGGAVVVDISLDGGTTWQVCTNGYALPSITAGFSGTNKTLIVRATLSSNTAYLSRLYINIYNTNSYNSDAGNRTISHANPSLTSSLFYPILAQKRAGIRGNNMTIASDATATPITMTAIEFWVKPNSLPAGAVFFDSRTAAATGNPYLGWNGTTFVTTGLGTVYLDGVPFSSANFTINEWHHVVIVRPAAENIPYVFGSDYLGVNIVDGDYGMIMLYPNTLAAQDVSDIYGSYFNFAGVQALDSGAIAIAEQATAYDLYDYDWSVIPS